MAATGTAAAAYENEVVVEAPGSATGKFDIEVPDANAEYRDQEFYHRDKLERDNYNDTAVAKGYVSSGQDRILFDGDPADVVERDVPGSLEVTIRSA
ncbi:hypothetical protein ELS17_08485 [Natrinema altunense]|uniref:Uncharacterized protein n=1 Tax=Natrinema altunense TaxID=222984 RepID=A0A482YAB7_9EURY|nr:hypothetical protein ELS17_08485 [Natrinema altunense]